MSEQLDSIASYSIGGTAIALSLANVASAAGQIAMILGCVVVIIRVVHDVVKLRRLISEKPNENGRYKSNYAEKE